MLPDLLVNVCVLLGVVVPVFVVYPLLLLHCDILPLLFVKVCVFEAVVVPVLVVYPAPLVIALLFKDIFAEPLNETPAIVLAVCNTVAEPALPVIVV
tara:strand:- start:625 stop:915 length:291 start_codon:yes stop_codon:yes gene_type:complete